MRVLMWFRSDLRIEDNTALLEAGRVATEGIVGVFAVCPSQWKAHDWGAMKVDFVLRSVVALARELSRFNIPLLINRCTTFDEVPTRLLRLAQRHHCGAIYFNSEYEANEIARDRAVETLFERQGLSVRSFADQTILDVETLRTNAGGYYAVYGPFKRKWLSDLKSTGCPSACMHLKKHIRLNIASDPVPNSLKLFTGHTRADLWPAGAQEAKSRLELFIADRIRVYDRRRDMPADHVTSTLSPYLAAGVISPRICLAAAFEANAGRMDSGHHGITTWIGELIWREFYRHVLIGFPRISRGRAFRTQTEKIHWNRNEDQFAAWCAGRTGVPIVDAGMRQLVETGWMHNRVRMIVAMYLTKDLLMDWRRGEAFFMNKLADGDFANNNGGWQWSASTGTDAAPYFRIFNPFTQAKKFDPDAQYIRRFIPELRSAPTQLIHKEKRHEGEIDYPVPIVEHNAARQAAIRAFKETS